MAKKASKTAKKAAKTTARKATRKAAAKPAGKAKVPTRVGMNKSELIVDTVSKTADWKTADLSKASARR